MTQRVRGILRLLLCVIAISAAWPACAQSQRPVRLRLEPLSTRGRSGGPIPLRIKLEYNQPQILEGDLILQIYNSYVMPEDLMATIRYEGIVLQGNDYIFNTVLPPIEHSHNELYEIVCWFDTKAGRLSLAQSEDNPEEPHELRSVGTYQRASLLASISGDREYLRARGNRAFLNGALSLENYNPDGDRAGNQQARLQNVGTRHVIHNTCNWDAYDLPEDPMHLCAFDVVLLADEALSRLEESQLKALLHWVRAGGSLCVLPDDNRLTGPHVEFLRTLFERDDDPDLHLSSSDDGTLLVISSQSQPVVNRRFGLGRATLLPNVEVLADHLTESQLGEVVGHLWKVRSNSGIFAGHDWQSADLSQLLEHQGKSLFRDGDQYFIRNRNANNFQPDLEGPFESPQQVAMSFRLQYELQPKSSPLAGACETALMPKGVEMVPAYVIALLLVAYVVTIGPIDYFVLGLFKARKYTWVLFPVVTVAFTVLTVHIAHLYMATTETGGRLSIIDVVEDGTPVRQTGLQMHFYGSQTSLREESTSSFSVPAQMNFSANDYGVQQAPRSVIRTIHYSGRFPQSYATTQEMRQWEPQINRSLTFSPDAADVPKISWNEPSLVSTHAGRDQLRDQLMRSATADGPIDAIVLHLTETYPLFRSRGFLFSEANMSSGRQWLREDVYRGSYRTPPQDAALAIGILQSASRTNTRDFFSIVSQMSPQGSASLEDLPLLDQTDARQWLLIIGVREGRHTRIYRRLYFVESDNGQNPPPGVPPAEKEDE